MTSKYTMQRLTCVRLEASCQPFYWHLFLQCSLWGNAFSSLFFLFFLNQRPALIKVYVYTSMAPSHSSHWFFLTIAVCACVLLSSGEIVMWDLTRTGKSKWSLFGTSSDSQSHNRIVFNLCSLQLPDGRELLVSTSMDREVCSSLLQNANGEILRTVILSLFFFFFLFPLRLNAGTWILWTAAGRCQPWAASSMLSASHLSVLAAWRWASATTWSGCGTR